MYKVLITGATRGIGRALALEFAGRGCSIAFCARSEAAVSAFELLLRRDFSIDAFGFAVDLSSKNEVQQFGALATKRLGGLDILVNNAGIVVGKPFVEHSHGEITREMQINTNALMHVTREVLPSMLARNYGHIVNIASAAALVANPRMSVYCASEWAVVGWSESLRLELAQMQSAVHVTTVMPYYIDTGMFAGVKSPILPILKPAMVVTQIARAITQNRIFLRMPWIVNVLPLLRGILPTRWFDVVVGEWFGVYHSMETFRGRAS